MLLADLSGEGDLDEGHRLWPHIEGWAAELGLTRTYVMVVAVIWGLTCGDAWGLGCVFWLREPHGDRGSEELERAGLDECRSGDFLDPLPVEIDDLPGESCQVA